MAWKLTEIFSEIGSWEDGYELYEWAVKAQENNQEPILLDGLYQLFLRPGPVTSEEAEECIAAFTKQGEQLDAPAFFVNMCASARAVFFIDNDGDHISEQQKERMQQLYDYLVESDAPVSAYGMQLIAFWTANEARLKYMRKTIWLREFLRDNPSLKDTDPAVWVAIARAIVDMNYPLPTDDPDFIERGSLISGIFASCARYGWIRPCEQTIYQVLENIVEYSDGPLFAMSMPIYQEHFDWISSVCEQVENSDTDMEGIVSLWHVAVDMHGKPAS